MKGSAWTDAPPLWRGIYIDLQHCRTGKIFKRLQAASVAEISALISIRYSLCRCPPSGYRLCDCVPHWLFFQVIRNFETYKRPESDLLAFIEQAMVGRARGLFPLLDKRCRGPNRMGPTQPTDTNALISVHSLHLDS